MNNYKLIFISSIVLMSVLISSCAENVENGMAQEELVVEDTSYIFQQSTESRTYIASTWNTQSEIQQKWIKLERDEDGYLIFDPCEGETPIIELDAINNILLCHWENGTTTDHPYQKYTRIKPNDALHIWADDIVCNLEIKDTLQKLVLWSFKLKNEKRFEWVMTPVEYENEFRKITDSCNLDRQFDFLPVEFTPKYPAE